MKHNTNLKTVNTIQEHEPSCVMQARRWRGQMALARLSLGKVPVHPSCKPLLCLHPSQQHRQDLHAHCRQTPPPAPAQSSHSQGSENSAMPVRRGRRKREPFQEKGGQPAQPSAIEDPREPCRGRWLCMLAPASPPRSPAEPSQVYTDAAMGKRPRPHIAVSEHIQSKRAGMLPAPHQQQCTQDPSFQA